MYCGWFKLSVSKQCYPLSYPIRFFLRNVSSLQSFGKLVFFLRNNWVKLSRSYYNFIIQYTFIIQWNISHFLISIIVLLIKCILLHLIIRYNTWYSKCEVIKKYFFFHIREIVKKYNFNIKKILGRKREKGTNKENFLSQMIQNCSIWQQTTKI